MGGDCEVQTAGATACQSGKSDILMYLEPAKLPGTNCSASKRACEGVVLRGWAMRHPTAYRDTAGFVSIRKGPTGIERDGVLVSSKQVVM